MIKKFLVTFVGSECKDNFNIETTECTIKYRLQESNSLDSKDNKIKVSISRELITNWHLPSTADLNKILFQYGKNEIIEKLKNQTLNDSEELSLSTKSHGECKYKDLENSEGLDKAVIEVEVEIK